MARSRNLFMVGVACALVLATLPSIALAAPVVAAATTSTAPLASGPIDGQIWPAQDGQTTAVIIDVTIDPKVDLPVRVRIPIPEGAVVQWAGEILAGDASADKQRDFTVQDGKGGGSYAEFTLSVSHRGQIDTSGIAMTVKGNEVSTRVDWIQSVPSTSTVFSVRLPAGASEAKIDPAPEGAPDTNSAGESLYLLPMQALVTGSTFTVKVAYNTSPTGATASSPTNLTALYIVLIVALVAAFAVVAYLLSRQRSREAESGEEHEQAQQEATDADADEADEAEHDQGDDTDSW